MFSSSDVNDVDRVWSVLHDGRWYTLQTACEKLFFLERPYALHILGFLVKYGFLTVNARNELGAPKHCLSPSEIVGMLQYYTTESELAS